MPYKGFVGKTGRVWNVTKKAVGIELLKTVGNRKRTKKLHVVLNMFVTQNAEMV